jgi:UDP-N-acetylmuramoyl-L-alanyl-D-glutamate--2,6-diaminopimelate ligase
MILREILNALETLSVTGDSGVDIKGVAYDSRKVMPGCLFVAMRGEKVDGHDYIKDAARRGAIAVICENPPPAPLSEGMDIPSPTTLVRVRDARLALACAANVFFMNPSSALAVAGITGTNGKTTTSYILKSILEAWGKKVGLIGTIQYMIGEEIFTATHTTPESLEFQELLSRMRAEGCSHVVSEVSSHALAQRRVDRTTFATAVFTNLTRDHLDFHKTMEEYYRAKTRLFTELLPAERPSIINQDDPFGRRLSGALRQLGRKVCTYGLETGSDLLACDISTSFAGLKFRVVSEGRRYDISSPLVGLPNVYNILSAAGASRALGIPWEAVLKGIRTSGNVRGRFERVDAGQRFLAVVDFAHTEDALERLIYTAKGLTKGKVITVFGCGGDRDRGKRARMGAVATRLSDFVVITSDNPRSEHPGEIIREIVAGAARKNYLTEPDRAEAIRRAVLIAGDNDIVIVAGKGHEQYQETGGRRIAFNDREVLEKSIKRLIANNNK